MVKQSLPLLVLLMLITLSGLSLSLLLIGTGVMLLIFAICRVVNSWFDVPPTHIAVNRLDLVMTDVPDIVDVFVGTPLGTALSVVCFGLINLYRSTISEVLSF